MSGLVLDMRIGQIWTFRDGKVVAESGSREERVDQRGGHRPFADG
jgi:hypothetical protein